MKTVKSIGGLLAIIFITLTYSCKKLVDVPPPTGQLVTSTVFNDNTTANAAQTAIYSEMVSDGGDYYLALYTGLSSDELTNYSTSSDIITFYDNSISPSNQRLELLWSNAYKYIYQANNIIEGLNTSNAVSSNVKRQLVGESKFLRSFWYFYLVNLFGDVPYTTTTNYKNNSLLSRTNKAAIYNSISEDLYDAVDSLSSNFVDATGLNITSERVRPTKWAAYALLSKLALYQGKWQTADSICSAILNQHAMFSLVNNFDSVFLKNSNEAIWQLQSVIPNFNTREGNLFILKARPLTGTNNCATVSSLLLSAFEPGDTRQIHWLNSVNSGGKTYIFPYKYKVSTSSVVTEYSMVFRLSEILLIQAEARAHLANVNGALSDLNIVRSRAGLLPVTTSNPDSISAAILQERHVELFTEWGNRWFDLIRTNTIDKVMTTASQQKGSSWHTTASLFPIPQIERTNDPNLSQNPNY